jgi:hypothetical protein
MAPVFVFPAILKQLMPFPYQLDIKLETNPRVASRDLFLKNANDDVEAKITEINW